MAIPLSPLTAAVQQESPYLEYVQALTIGFPRLKLLADFMSPNHRIVGFNTDADVVLRMKHVDVTVVDHSSIEGVSTKIAVPHRFRDLRALDNHLDIKPVLSGSVRVVLVENISRDVIELLGSRYALDPRFFENHVRGIERFLAAKWSGDKVQRLEDAAPQLIRRPFATVDFARPYRFQNWEEVYLLRAKTTVPRLGNVASNFYMKENVSIYGPVKCKQGYSVCKWPSSTSYRHNLLEYPYADDIRHRYLRPNIRRSSPIQGASSHLQ